MYFELELLCHVQDSFAIIVTFALHSVIQHAGPSVLYTIYDIQYIQQDNIIKQDSHISSLFWLMLACACTRLMLHLYRNIEYLLT